MNSQKNLDKKFQFNDFVKRIGNQVNVANLQLNIKDFKSYNDLAKEENKPFQPIRPRIALIRADKQSRKKIEQRYKAKIHEVQKKPYQIVFNPEQEKENRQDKEEWMLDLQEIYDKIHEELTKIIKSQQSNQAILNPEQQKKFKEVLGHQMEETEAMMSRLQMPDKKSLQSTREGLLIAKQFRQSLKDLYSIMECVQITQIQKLFAQDFDFLKKLRQLRSKQLLKEIKNSTERLEKVRIGNSLDHLLQKQKSNYEKQKLAERSKILNEYLKLRKKYPYDDDIKFEELQYFKNDNERSMEIQQILSDFEKAENEIKQKYIEKEQQEKQDLKASQQDLKQKPNKQDQQKYLKMDQEIVQKNEFALTAARFDNQRQKVEQIVEKVNNIQGAHVDFDHKYKNINRYFEERKQLSQLYLGGTRLQKFLKDFDEKCKLFDSNQNSKKIENLERAKSMDSINFFDIDFNQEIEPINSPTQNIAPTQQKKENTLQKVMKINQEIQMKLMEEEHEDKMNQIKRLGVEQNQNYWDQLLEQSNKHKNQKNKLKIQPKAQTSHGARPAKRDSNLLSNLDFKEKTEQKIQSTKSLSHFYLTEPLLIQEKERQMWLEKQQRLILNAHHKNPILNIAFQQNKQLKYNQQNNFSTVPVNNMNFLVRREQAKTSEVKYRSQIQQDRQQQQPNKNNDDNFRNTFFQNFYLFQDSTTTTPHSFLSNTNYTIRYPSTANQKERPNKWVQNP
ncbi:hypothetical protein TTHERM_00353330 (macronuclear) [Tetrahymena thermophila SB210]|uniref:Uncharacterized protein n=1 Tax=Tetrahymena thermophila (strain SB210) TaxID=312017 RepID=I7MHC6_TETTS|nr:hypothetical protein TTHERM_00353330 [Tetrahymena thermophila SB210]EAS02847.2 hypothetical protein TTHERM_00353330 [Tetrahymena thermophila SB210]|eukprot:XP_001023092.2 hypothetical protein TTHERM_00353330 [Tetrahymena thermophila SB210]